MFDADLVDPITIDDLSPISTPARHLNLAGMQGGEGGRISIADIFALLTHGDVAGLLAALDIGFDPSDGPLISTNMQAALAETALLIASSVAERVRHDSAQNLDAAHRKQARINIGALFAGVAVKSAAYSVVGSDAGGLICVNAAAAARAITLPPLGDVGDGFCVAIKKVDTSFNVVTVTGTVDAVSNKLLRMPGQAVLLVSDNSNGTWRVVAEAGTVVTGTVAGASYERHADGRQVCRTLLSITPVANTPTAATFTYPVAFTSMESAQVSANTGATSFLYAAYSNLGTSAVDVYVHRTNTTLTSVSVTVAGRWF